MLVGGQLVLWLMLLDPCAASSWSVTNGAECRMPLSYPVLFSPEPMTGPCAGHLDNNGRRGQSQSSLGSVAKEKNPIGSCLLSFDPRYLPTGPFSPFQQDTSASLLAAFPRVIGCVSCSGLRLCLFLFHLALQPFPFASSLPLLERHVFGKHHFGRHHAWYAQQRSSRRHSLPQQPWRIQHSSPCPGGRQAERGQLLRQRQPAEAVQAR